MCKIPLATFEAYQQHTRMWHHTPDSWSCPRLMKNITPDFFFDTSNAVGITYHACLCCGKEFYEDPPNADERKRHLIEEHKFHEHENSLHTSEKFFRIEKFQLHLANCHHVQLKYLAEITDICCQEDRAPALAVGCKNEKFDPRTNQDNTKRKTSTV